MTRYNTPEDMLEDLTRLKNSDYEVTGVRTISFSLPEDLFHRINKIVDEGDYVSRSGLIRESVRMHVLLNEKGIDKIVQEAVRKEITDMIQKGFIIVRENRGRV